MTHSVPPQDTSRTSSTSRKPLYVIGLVVVVLLVIGIVPRISQRRALAADVQAASDTITPVSVVTATRAKRGPLSLPGTIQALHETMVYARSSGYVRRWYTDIGRHVRAGQVLADIESPEVDQDVQQGRANLKQANAALALAKSDLDRWKSLERDSAVSQQELDQKVAAYEANLAAVHAQEANVQRLSSLQGYEKIVAPFAGTITARNLDVGTLVQPGAQSAIGSGSGAASGAGMGGQGLFRIEQTDTMRVYVSVPQSFAPAITVGQAAQVGVQEMHGRTFPGRVARTAAALDPSTRTLLVEVDVPNTDHTLLAGSFAQVTLSPMAAASPILAPANALLFDQNGTQVATVGTDNVVHYHKVEVGRDYGATVEILSGIDEGATLLLNPSEDIPDGRTVKPMRVAGK
jgi:multidrug efflux pump subunit AcrA (membrane-fusion protein)